MRTRSAWIVAAFVALTAAFPAGAQDSATLKKIKDRKSIVLGVREAADPFSYVDAKGQYIGYSIDLCGKIVDTVKAAQIGRATRLNSSHIPLSRMPSSA